MMNSTEFDTPKRLINLFKEIVILDENATILDPCSGRGILLEALLDENSYKEAYCIEINRTSYDYSKELLKSKKNISFYCGDFLDTSQKVEKADVVVADPPLGLKYKTQSNSGDGTSLFVDKILDHLNTNGTAYIIVTNSFLYAKQTEKVRNRIKEHFNLEAIIHIPQGTFAPLSNISANLLIVKNNQYSDKTFIINTKDLKEIEGVASSYKQFSLGNDVEKGQIAENFASLESWSINKYLLCEEVPNSLSNKYKDTSLSPLKDVFELEYFSGDVLATKKYDVVIFPKFNTGKVILPESFDTISKTKNSKYIGGTLKNDKFIPEFFYLYASQDEYLKQVALFSTGTTISNINISDYGKIKIPNLDIKTQTEIVTNWLKIISHKNIIEIIERQFNKDYLNTPKDLEMINNSIEPVATFPEPVATNYYQFKNTIDPYKKIKSLFIAYESIVRFFGMSILCALRNMKDFESDIERTKYVAMLNKYLPSIYTPISVKFWANTISLGVTILDKSKSFFSDHVQDIDTEQLVKSVEELSSARNDYAHSLNSLQEEKILIKVAKLENNLTNILKQFSFMSKYPLVHIESTARKRHENVYTMLYLIGDSKTKREGIENSTEEFFTSLYLYSNWPNKSLDLYPLIIFESCPICAEREVLFFDYFDKSKDTPIYRGCSKSNEEIPISEMSQDIKDFFTKIE